MNKEEILEKIDCDFLNTKLSVIIEKLFLLAISMDTDKKDAIIEKYFEYKETLFPEESKQENFKNYLERIGITKIKYTNNDKKHLLEEITKSIIDINKREYISKSIYIIDLENIPRSDLFERLFCLSLLSSGLNIDTIQKITSIYLSYREILYPNFSQSIKKV